MKTVLINSPLPCEWPIIMVEHLLHRLGMTYSANSVYPFTEKRKKTFGLPQYSFHSRDLWVHLLTIGKISPMVGSTTTYHGCFAIYAHIKKKKLGAKELMKGKYGSVWPITNLVIFRYLFSNVVHPIIYKPSRIRFIDVYWAYPIRSGMM